MNKPQIDEYRLDVVDRLARIESTLAVVHRDSHDTKLEIQVQNGRVRKLEGGMASIQGVFLRREHHIWRVHRLLI